MVSGDPTSHQGPIAAEWFSRVLLPKHPIKPIGEGKFCEMQTSAMVVGLLITGKVAQGLDSRLHRRSLISTMAILNVIAGLDILNLISICPLQINVWSCHENSLACR